MENKKERLLGLLSVVQQEYEELGDSLKGIDDAILEDSALVDEETRVFDSFEELEEALGDFFAEAY
jgi:hypothetical protein